MQFPEKKSTEDANILGIKAEGGLGKLRGKRGAFRIAIRAGGM